MPKKLTEAEVAEIRGYIETGFTFTVIASWFSVGRRSIGDIARGRTWRRKDGE
jgi:hypothetical protein